MTQQHLNEVKRECFADVIKFADELEGDGRFCAIGRTRDGIEVYSHINYFIFMFSNYDTTLEAGQEFYKQFNKFKQQFSCKTNN